MDRRVLVTGIGVVSPIGIGKEKFWQALINGESGIDTIKRFDASSYDSQIAGEVKTLIVMIIYLAKTLAEWIAFLNLL